MLFSKMLMGVGGTTSLTIAASVRNPDVYALATAAGWSGSGLIRLTINAGVDVATLTIPNSIPSGLLTIINNGRIGGVLNGGTALTVRSNATVINNGTIFGGGGNGGAGAWKAIFRGTGYVATGSAGSGGNGAGFTSSGSVAMVGQTSGTAGSPQTIGGPSIGGTTQGTATGGRGGDGGAIGVQGQPGNYGTTSGTFESQSDGTPGAGGAAGNYIDGNVYVAWQVPGTRLGNAI